MYNAVDHSVVRSTNQYAILSTIYKENVTTRSQLARNLSMSKPAISDNLNLLIDLGIVKEIGKGEASKLGGRKPVLISFNKNFKYIIAIDLNFKDPILALMNLRGEILKEIYVDIEHSSATRLELMISNIEFLLSSENIKPEQLAYIAISSPGVFSSESSKPFTNEQFAQWFEEDVFSALSTHYSTQVVIKNDANCAAFGEFNYGAGLGSEN